MGNRSRVIVSIISYLSLIGACCAAVEEPDTGPIFMLEPPSNVLVYRDLGKTIFCTAHGKPAPVMGWQLANGSSIPATHNKYIKIHTNNSLQLLPFSGEIISAVHRAAYRCVAKNSVGKVVSRSVHVKTVKTEAYINYAANVQDVWVMKGNTAVFTCNIRPSYMRPFVSVNSWHVGIEEIRSGGRYTMLDSTLHLSNVDDHDDLRQIKCVTVNLMNNNTKQASSRATLHVVNPVQTNPAIEYKRDSITSKSGVTVTLPCVAEAFPIARYVWSKNGVSINQSRRIRVTRGDLKITNTTIDDSGMYRCNASNIHGYSTTNTNLLVTEPLYVRMSPKAQKIDATLPAELLCQVSGGPYSQITWYKNGSPLTFNDNIRKLSDFQLRISSVSRRDIGMYQCLVSSSDDNIQASSQLQLGVSAPIFHNKSDPLFVHPDEAASLMCKVYGNPPPTVSWLLAHTPLQSHKTDGVKVGQYMTAEGDIVSHVNITSLKLTDGGTYVCIANNSIGEARQSTQLNVYGIPLVRSMSNQTAVANKVLRLVCYVSGYPVKTVSWSKDGSILRKDHRITYTEEGVLTITSVAVSDEGYYNCSALNDAGQGSSARVYVSVLTEPVLMDFDIPALTEGERHIAMCQIKGGDQPIQLSWYRNGLPIVASSFPSITVTINPPFSSTLTFRSVRTSDIANYTCVATNKAGVVNVTAELSVVNVRPYWVVSPEDDSVIVGYKKQLPCHGAGTPTPTITWKKAIDLSSQKFRVITDEDIGKYEVLLNGSLLVKNANLEDGEFYICQISNGIAPDISQLVLLSVHAPVRYNESAHSQHSRVGEEVVLVCEAFGDLPISTAWSKRTPGESVWTQISNSDPSRISISNTKTETGWTSVLTLQSALRTDNGEYVCTSKNDFGLATKNTQLTVQEKPAAVDHLKATDLTSKGVALSWMLTDDGNSAITEYIIQYLPLTMEWSTGSRQVIKSFKTQTVISGLMPATWYKMRVIAVNGVGESDASYELIVKTEEEQPSGPPRNVKLTSLSSAALNLTWLPPQSSLLNGQLLGYRIGYKVCNSSADYSYMKLSSPDHNFFKLINLDMSICYSVILAAYNKKGLGPHSFPVMAFTFEDVPSSPPTNVSATVGQSSLTVKWKQPHLPYFYGQLSGYKVLIHGVNSEQDERKQQIKSTQSTEVTFRTIDVYTNYSIQVLAYAANGDGVRSNPIFTMTPPSPPGKPRLVSAAPVNSSGILVSWLDPHDVNGVIQQYQLAVYSGPKAVRNITVTHPNLKRQLIVDDLAQGQLYGFTVRAKNYQTVYGVESEEITATPLPNVVPVLASVNTTVQAGHHKSLRLSCPAVGDPEPSITWTKNRVDGRLPGHKLPGHFTVLGNGTVFVEKILKEDTDSYTCTASNLHGHSSLTFLLQVLEVSPDVPSAPTLTVNKILASSVQVNWINANNGGFPINGWSIEIRDGGGWKAENVASSERSYWFRQLSCGQGYGVRMRATNQEGSSAYSSALSVSTLGGKPLLPSEDGMINTVNKTSVVLDLSKWSDNGCPLSFFSVSYGKVRDDKRTLLSPISSSLQSVQLTDLEPANWYNVDITAHNSAGRTTTSLTVSTLTVDGSTVAPLHQADAVEDTEADSTPVALFVSISIVIVVILLATVGCFLYCNRRKILLHYKGGNKSRQSMFSDTSDLDTHHHARTPFEIPRENLSGDSGVWLLQHPASLKRSDQISADKCDAISAATVYDNNRKLPTRDSSLSPYAMFIYASARSGDYETCTPTLSFSRGNKMCKRSEERCVHGAFREHCQYCEDHCDQQKLMGIENSDQFDKLKQFEISAFDPCDDEFPPPPPPEALHEYHCEPAGKRCMSHEFMRHTGGASLSRPNTTGLRIARMDTPGRVSQYPSCLMSSMATVSSNQEELLSAYHNSKVNPPGPILFESPQPLSTSLSPESSVATEPGIRMFTQSPPKPEESRQAVCEVPIYSTTLPSGCILDHSSDTTTDQEPRSKSSRLKSPQRRLYKRKQKRSRSQKRFRDVSDEMSTNSDDCSPYGIPYHSSSISSTSDKGYGTKNKDTDESLKTSSHHRSRDCGDLYEEEEKMSLVQTAIGAGETTPPSSQRNLATDFENEKLVEDTRLIDRYYRTVSAHNTDSRPVETYTEDYTIV